MLCDGEPGQYISLSRWGVAALAAAKSDLRGARKSIEAFPFYINNWALWTGESMWVLIAACCGSFAVEHSDFCLLV